jgi:hypothetical protein
VEKMIVAMRGRPSEGGHNEQRLEPNLEGTSNTITTVTKDNLVMIKVRVANSKGYTLLSEGGGGRPQLPYK